MGVFKRNFANSVQGIDIDTDAGIDHLKDSTRKSVYDLISSVAVLGSEEQRRGLYNGVNNALAEYNEKRVFKTDISRSREFIEKHREGEDSEVAQTTQGILDKVERHNAELYLGFLKETSELFVTFCCQIPGNSFLKIPGFEAPTSEGNMIGTANRFLSSFDPAQHRSGNEFNKVIDKMSDSFFYLQIQDEGALEKHQEDTREKLKNHPPEIQAAFTRTNAPEVLASSMAQHLHVMFTNPKIEALGRDEVANAFVRRVIGGEHKVKNPRAEEVAVKPKDSFERAATKCLLSLTSSSEENNNLFQEGGLIHRLTEPVANGQDLNKQQAVELSNYLLDIIKEQGGLPRTNHINEDANDKTLKNRLSNLRKELGENSQYPLVSGIKDIKLDQGWPEFATEEIMAGISRNVSVEVERLRQETQAKHYTSKIENPRYAGAGDKSLRSSGHTTPGRLSRSVSGAGSEGSLEGNAAVSDNNGSTADLLINASDRLNSMLQMSAQKQNVPT